MRSHDELEDLAAMSEREGGYAVRNSLHTTEVHVGDVALEGRDAIEFLVHLLRRAQERMSFPSRADYNQGYRDAMREAARAAAELAENFRGESDFVEPRQ